MTYGQNFEHALFFEMGYDKVLSKVYKAKAAKGICLARCYTVSD